jgi:hypothetical protein
MTLDVIRIVIRLLASIWKYPESKYWTACFPDQNDKHRRLTTKETDPQESRRRSPKEYDRAVRTKRTLRQAQMALDRNHQDEAFRSISSWNEDRLR